MLHTCEIDVFEIEIQYRTRKNLFIIKNYVGKSIKEMPLIKFSHLYVSHSNVLFKTTHNTMKGKISIYNYSKFLESRE